ncbi:hypothetical protein K470DRAFT_295389 [Piedraia hortae CBS 480.64]|uniref:Uncharacterized protein n=1 Tax=Piedraia hortae CBS 480.64 TaxID=1314780 RepID=A0A6A7BX59_9PEZI|nr:hypothetical protein K470DRAFT_295389 [Piedraia hortae CBS 480.64]
MPHQAAGFVVRMACTFCSTSHAAKLYVELCSQMKLLDEGLSTEVPHDKEGALAGGKTWFWQYLSKECVEELKALHDLGRRGIARAYKEFALFLGRLYNSRVLKYTQILHLLKQMLGTSIPEWYIVESVTTLLSNCGANIHKTQNDKDMIESSLSRMAKASNGHLTGKHKLMIVELFVSHTSGWKEKKNIESDAAMTFAKGAQYEAKELLDAEKRANEGCHTEISEVPNLSTMSSSVMRVRSFPCVESFSQDRSNDLMERLKTDRAVVAVILGISEKRPAGLVLGLIEWLAQVLYR